MMTNQEIAQEIYNAMAPTVEKVLNELVAAKQDPLSVAFAAFHSSAGKVLESLAGHFTDAREVLAAGNRFVILHGPRKLLCEHFDKAAGQAQFSTAPKDKVLLFVQVGAEVFFWRLDFGADPVPGQLEPS